MIANAGEVSGVYNDVIASAGEALAMLSANEINSSALYNWDDEIVAKLDTIISSESVSIVQYKSFAAQINSYVCMDALSKMAANSKVINQAILLLLWVVLFLFK